MNKLIAIVGLVVTLVAVAWCWPWSRIDSQQVHPNLRDLQRPYRAVTTEYYLDGGSIGVRIVDRDRHVLELALPVEHGQGQSYCRLFLGAMHASKTNAVEIPFTSATRRMLIRIIDQNRTSSESDLALVYLRGAPRDYAHLYGRAAVSFLRGQLR